MTDTELDEILDQWNAPQPPPELRGRMRAGFTKRPRRKGWSFMPAPGKGLFAGAVLAALTTLLIVFSAPSQPRATIPWTVDSQFLRYSDDGSSSVEMRMTSYELNGNEILLSRSMPGNPFETALGRTLDVIQPAWGRFITPFVISPDQLERARKIRQAHPGVSFITGCGIYTGCLVLEHYGFAKTAAGSSGCIAGSVVDRATILNYPTEAVRERWTEHGRMTLWTAPQLGCFALKVTYEDQRVDGSFHLVSAKQAIQVKLNP